MQLHRYHDLGNDAEPGIELVQEKVLRFRREAGDRRGDGKNASRNPSRAKRFDDGRHGLEGNRPPDIGRGPAIGFRRLVAEGAARSEKTEVRADRDGGEEKRQRGLRKGRSPPSHGNDCRLAYPSLTIAVSHRFTIADEIFRVFPATSPRFPSNPKTPDLSYSRCSATFNGCGDVVALGTEGKGSMQKAVHESVAVAGLSTDTLSQDVAALRTGPGVAPGRHYPALAHGTEHLVHVHFP